MYNYSVVLIASTCVVIGIAFLLKTSSVSKTSRHQEVDNAWVSSLYDLMRVSGPVHFLTVEGTEIGTDSALSTLRRYPLIKFHYDASGRVIKTEDLNEQGAPRTSTDYVYDSEGRIVKGLHRDNAQVVSSETLYKYGLNGRPEEQVRIDGDDGAILSKRMFIYDETTGGTQINSWSGERLRASVEVFRNSRGQIVEARSIPYEPAGSLGRSLSGKVTVTYNNLGDVETESSFDSRDKLVEEAVYSYEYDARNNWVKRTKDIKHFSLDGTSSLGREIFHRNITYK